MCEPWSRITAAYDKGFLILEVKIDKDVAVQLCMNFQLCCIDNKDSTDVKRGGAESTGMMSPLKALGNIMVKITRLWLCFSHG